MTKVAVITGGTKGIGEALVRQFASKGFHIFTCSRSKEDLEKLTKEFEEGKSTSCVTGFKADLSKKDECSEFISFINQNIEEVDVLINNTGIFMPGQLHQEEEGQMELIMQTNLYSAYYITRGLLPLMIEKKSGHIFNMCSTASIVPYTNGGSYCISKFALLGMSKVLREELKEFGIKVTSVLPGATYTESWRNSGLPESRFMKSTDIAETIWSALNLSDQAVVEEILIRPQSGDV